MFEKEKIYIAGPECFYTRGYTQLAYMRKRAEGFGFGVTLPNDDPLDLENPDKQKRADSILDNLKKVMNDTTVIIADLESFRGAEADSGTVFEIGMAYAKNAKCYGYTRDKRNLVWKDQQYKLVDGVVYDEHGDKAPYADLPFSPTIVGSTKIVEGDFDDCLKMLMTDMEEEYKHKAFETTDEKPKSTEEVKNPRPVVYLSGTERYHADAVAIYDRMKKLCNEYGLDAISPLDGLEEIEGITNPYTRAAAMVDIYHKHIKGCDAIIANTNDYKGYEVSNDTGFECGIGLQLGKKLYGYMDNTERMINKIPHMGEASGYKDAAGCDVENFDYPVNLMFGSSMNFYEGKFEEVMKAIAEDLLK